MFCLLSHLSLAAKVDVAFQVKYTSSCTYDPRLAFLMIDNNGKELIPALKNNQTHVLVEPGNHIAVALHPWCEFYKVEFKVNEDGLVDANSNGVHYKKFPIPIKHPKLANAADPLTKAQDMTHYFFLLVPVFLVLKKFIPKNLGERMKDFAEKQREEMERMKREANNNH